MRVLPYGETALLVEVADHEVALALFEQLRAHPIPGTTDVVPAAQTVLLQFVHPAGALQARATLESRRTPEGRAGPGEYVEIPVVYDGQDVQDVAHLTGLEPAEVVRRHQQPEYRVAFTGFAPGFGYLVGGDPALIVPRRDNPRTRVPAGSVAVAGEFCAVYPRVSPGGWQLLGRTDAALWDLQRDPPALLAPGTRVRFTQVGM